MRSQYVEYQLPHLLNLCRSLLLELDHQGLGFKDQISLLIQPIPIIRIRQPQLKIPYHFAENHARFCKEDPAVASQFMDSGAKLSHKEMHCRA